MSLRSSGQVVGRVLNPRGIGMIRTGIGVLAVTKPTLIPRFLGVDRVTADRVTWLVRMMGAREIALGAGAAYSPTVPWVLAGVLADSTDAVSTFLAVRDRQQARVTGTLVGLSAVAAAAAGALGAVRAARR